MYGFIATLLVAALIPSTAMAGPRDSHYGDPYPTDTVRVYDATGGVGWQAAQTWDTSGITILQVDTADEADIIVQWGDTTSTASYWGSRFMIRSTVTIDSEAENPLAVAVHYIGHALGYRFHATEEPSAMHYNDHDNPTATQPSASDLRILRRIYTEN